MENHGNYSENKTEKSTNKFKRVKSGIYRRKLKLFGDVQIYESIKFTVQLKIYKKYFKSESF